MDVQPHTEQEAIEQTTGTGPAVDQEREEYDERVYRQGAPEGISPQEIAAGSVTFTSSKVILDVDGGMLRIKLNDRAKAARSQSGPYGFMALGLDYDIEVLDIYGKPLPGLSRKVTAIKFEFTGRKAAVNTTITFEE